MAAQFVWRMKGACLWGELELKRAVQEDIYGGGSPEKHYSDSQSSPSNSPTSHSSSVLGSHDFVLHFTASTRSSCRSGGSSSSCSGCFSTSMSVEDDGDAGDEDCFDDWETMADAFAATEVQQKEQEQEPISFSGFDSHIEKHGSEYCSQIGEITQGSDISEKERRGTDLKRTHSDCRAWRADDASRPQSLPNLSKQYSFPLNLEHHLVQGRSAWGSVNVGPVPTPCPICCEDLDGTNSSFIPCLCGFRLCLFCHKRILEDNGRFPGCRKQFDYLPAEYKATLDDGNLTFQ